MRRHVAPLATLLVVLASTGLTGGCGLHPLYAGGSQGLVAKGLAKVEVSSISGRDGWLMHAALAQRLSGADNRSANGGSAPRYRLDVRLDDQLVGLGLLSNNMVGRERRSLRARYQLIDLTNNQVLLDTTAGSDAGIEVVTSEYATVAAEQTAIENLTHIVADQIITNVAERLTTLGPASAAAP